MPETYGLPEPEPTRREEAERIFNEVIAGQSVVRRILFYVVAGLSLVLLSGDGAFGVIGGGLGIIALLLLMATDRSLA